MTFEPIAIESLIKTLDTLSPDAKPLWGSMSAQRMVEHLADSLKVANGKVSLPLEIPEENIPKMQSFLASEKPLPKLIYVSFALPDTPLRHEEIELAIDEVLLEWIDFEDHFSAENHTVIHPYYGALNYDQWCRLHAKHVTHHLEQFGLTLL